MHAMEMSGAVAQAQTSDRLVQAARMRAIRPASASAAPAGEPDEVVMRLARPLDALDLERLRRLDGRPGGWGHDTPILVALADGELVAALAMGRPDDVVADPFRRTASLAELLRERARQVAAPGRRGRRLRPVLRVVRAR